MLIFGDLVLFLLSWHVIFVIKVCSASLIISFGDLCSFKYIFITAWCILLLGVCSLELLPQIIA